MKNIPKSSEHIDYGQDAPGVRLGMFAIAAVGVVVFVASGWVPASGGGVVAFMPIGVAVLGGIALLYGLWMGG